MIPLAQHMTCKQWGQKFNMESFFELLYLPFFFKIFNFKYQIFGGTCVSSATAGEVLTLYL